MMEIEFLKDIINRLDEAYEFLDRNKGNLDYTVSHEYYDIMNTIWDAQTRVEVLTKRVEDRYAAIARSMGNE